MHINKEINKKNKINWYLTKTKKKFIILIILIPNYNAHIFLLSYSEDCIKKY